MKRTAFDIKKIRADFPGLQDPNQVYLDSAATAQTCADAIACITNFYTQTKANVHRGSNQLTNSLTDRFEQAREQVGQFIGSKPESIIWTRGATEGINLIAYSFALPYLNQGDEILISEMEHHANIVPWQLIATMTKAKIVKIPLEPDGKLDLNAFEKALSS